MCIWAATICVWKWEQWVQFCSASEESEECFYSAGRQSESDKHTTGDNSPNCLYQPREPMSNTRKGGKRPQNPHRSQPRDARRSTKKKQTHTHTHGDFLLTCITHQRRTSTTHTHTSAQWRTFLSEVLGHHYQIQPLLCNWMPIKSKVCVHTCSEVCVCWDIASVSTPVSRCSEILSSGLT